MTDTNKDGEDIFNKAVFANGINLLKENLKEHIDLLRINAHLRKVKYDAFIAEEFTPEQALYLITKIGLFE